MRLICQTTLFLATAAVASCTIHPAPPGTKTGAAPGADAPGGPLAQGSVVPAAAVGADLALGSGLQPPLPATGTLGPGPAAPCLNL